MIEKHTFVSSLNNLASFVEKVNILEDVLEIMFDNNFLTNMIDSTLVTLGESFFTEEELNDSNCKVTTVIDMLYHFAFMGEFGNKIAELQRFYVENENTKDEQVFNAFTSIELYTIIDRYIHLEDDSVTVTMNLRGTNNETDIP